VTQKDLDELAAADEILLTAEKMVKEGKKLRARVKARIRKRKQRAGE
jgi:hypothetical protein